MSISDLGWTLADYWLYDFTRYLLAAGGLSVILWLFGNWATRRRTQSRRASWTDRKREFIYSASTVVIFAVVGVAVDASGWFKLYYAVPATPTLIVELVFIVVLHDAYFYAIHRAMHHPRLYHRFHRVHHLSRTPTPWAAYAFAPAEALLEALILPIAASLMSISILTVFLFMTHMVVRNVIGHCGVELLPRSWLRWRLTNWITTTTHHDLHHESYRWNYGLHFTWWDRLCGTEHPQYATRFLSNATSRRKSKPFVPADPASTAVHVDR